MLRFKFLVSTAPLIAAAIFARVEFFPSSRPCIPLASSTVEIASTPWHADLHVSFTDDPKLATVRVAISDDAASADFAVVDDSDVDDDNVCETTPATQFISISHEPAAPAPVIYLSHGDRTADYSVFVRSKRFTEREAAALIVAAHRPEPRVADAAL